MSKPQVGRASGTTNPVQSQEIQEIPESQQHLDATSDRPGAPYQNDDVDRSGRPAPQIAAPTPSPVPVAPPPLVDITTVPSAQRAQLFALLKQFTTPMVLQMHVAWHQKYGSPDGMSSIPDIGEIFLRAHQGMIADYENYVKAHGGAQFYPLPGYHPNTAIPPEFPDPEAKNPDASTHRLTNSPNYVMPSWLTLEGGTQVAPYPPGAGYTKISDFKTLDELGRALCTSPGAGQLSAHASAHVLIGGDMNTFQSPKDEIFPLWHKLIDYYRELWASTPNGQAFFAANPDKLKPLPMGGMKMGGPLNGEYLAHQPLFNPDGSAIDPGRRPRRSHAP